MRIKRRMICRAGWAAVLAAVLAAGSGCVAINVGKPEVFRHTEPVVTRGKSPVMTEVMSVEAKSQVNGNHLKVWLDAQVEETYQRLVHTETKTTTAQKRLAIGLFPGAAGYVYAPPGRPCKLGGFIKVESVMTLVTLGFVPAFDTVLLIVFEPFVSWNTVARRAEELHSGFNSSAEIVEVPSCGFLGLHKYWQVSRTGPARDGPDRDAGVEARRRTEKMAGPYEVELHIPWAGISSKAIVGAESREATFALPQVDRGGSYEATLEFRSLYTGLEDALRASWTTRTLKQTVWLQEKPKTAVQAPAREVVKEIHHYHETRVVEERKAEGPPYNVEKSADGTGRTVWRVKILAETQNAFTVDREVKAQILQELRDDFAGRNPHVPRGEINAFATYTTEDGGRTLVYVGVAESLIPSLESLTYSAETHRGTVTMRLAGGADLPRSKEFVRNNISAIVCDKNVVLTAGERPPDGAKYRSLDENFADGVLTVEFEAVE